MSFDDVTSGDRPCPFGYPTPCVHAPAHYVIAEEHSANTPWPWIGAVAAATGTEVALIVTGRGWWVLPVALLIGMFCVLLVCTSWDIFREIGGVFRETRRPARHEAVGHRSPPARPDPPKPVVPGAALYPLGTVMPRDDED